jgi:hypothetical protein
MTNIDRLKRAASDQFDYAGWSHRRSAALLLAAGAIFWSIVFFIVFRWNLV